MTLWDVMMSIFTNYYALVALAIFACTLGGLVAVGAAVKSYADVLDRCAGTFERVWVWAFGPTLAIWLWFWFSLIFWLNMQM